MPDGLKFRGRGKQIQNNRLQTRLNAPSARQQSDVPFEQIGQQTDDDAADEAADRRSAYVDAHGFADAARGDLLIQVRHGDGRETRQADAQQQPQGEQQMEVMGERRKNGQRRRREQRGDHDALPPPSVRERRDEHHAERQ
nr:hypothetical protein [Paenibacillus lycopersici]